MKKNILKPLILAALAGISFTGCKRYVETISSSPDYLLSDDVTSKNLLQGALLNLQFELTSGSVRLTTMWMNQATGIDRQYVALNNWNNTVASDHEDTWTDGYLAMASGYDLEQKSLKEQNYKSAGVGEIVKAFSGGILTSLFGDIPYSQFNPGVNMNPTFDTQKDVYNQIQATLDMAIANLGKPGKIDSDKDIYFSGDASKWIKVANALKARYYLNVKDYTNARKYAQLGISSPSEDYVAHFGPVNGKNQNPWGDFLDYSRNGYLAANDAYAPEILDPANPLYRGNAKTNETARFNYIYVPNGGNNYDLNVHSSADYGFKAKFGIDTNTPILTYGEMLLIIAECDARLSGFTSGLTSYNKYRELLNTGYLLSSDAISSYSYEYDDYTSEDFAAGGMVNKDSLSPVNALLKEISQERYIYFIGDFQAFTDFGRNSNLAGITMKNYPNSPQRLLYSQTELNSNPNVPKPAPGVTVKLPVNN